MARTKRAALCAIATLSLAGASAGSAQAYDGTGSFGVGSPFSYTGGSELGLNLFNFTACGDDTPGATRCDAFVLTAESTGPATFSLNVPDALASHDFGEEIGSLALGADFDMNVYRGSEWVADGELPGSTGLGSGADETVTTDAASGDVFRVEIIHYTSVGDSYTLTAGF